MIKSFADKRTKQIFEGKFIKRVDKNLQNKALRRLRYLDAAENIEDLRIPPSNKLEKKQGDLKDFYSIWINDQWRIIFKWVDSEAREVQFIDYH